MIGLFTAAVIAACGSDDGPAESTSADGDDGSGDQTPESASNGDEPESEDESASVSAGTGSIRIGDTSHDLTVGRCITLGGSIGGSATSVSEPDNVSVDFSFSPEDWQERPTSEGWTDSGHISLDVDEPDVTWVSGVGRFKGHTLPDHLDPASLDITSLEIDEDNQVVRGEAVFINVQAVFTPATAAETMPVDGSFEFACPPK